MTRRARLAMVLVAAVAAVALVAVACEPAPTPVPQAVPPGQPLVDCRAPAETCRTVVADARNQVGPGVVPIRIQVVCQPGCTLQSGAADVTVQYSDGSSTAWSMGWEGAPPAPLPAEGGANAASPRSFA